MKEKDFKSLIAPGDYGIDIDNNLSKEQLQRIEEYINWKLNDIQWWKEWGVQGTVEVKVDKMIEDRDFQLIERTGIDGNKIYEVFSDCDRYRFCCAFLFNEDATEFQLNEEV